MKKIIQKIKNWYQGEETELIAVEREKHVDIYARYEKSTSARFAAAIVNYWTRHWQWTLSFIVAVIACIFAFPPFYDLTYKQKPATGTEQPKQNNEPKNPSNSEKVDAAQTVSPPVHKSSKAHEKYTEKREDATHQTPPVDGQPHKQPTETLINGTVLDEDKQPIEGAVVSIVGSSTKTETDKWGNYKLTITSSTKESVRLRVIKSGFKTDDKFQLVGAVVQIHLRRQ